MKIKKIFAFVFLISIINFNFYNIHFQFIFNIQFHNKQVLVYKKLFDYQNSKFLIQMIDILLCLNKCK